MIIIIIEKKKSAVNVLTNSPQIFHITETDFFQLSFLRSDQKYDKGAVRQISKMFWIFFTTFLLEGSSETRLSSHLSNHVFRSP